MTFSEMETVKVLLDCGMTREQIRNEIRSIVHVCNSVHDSATERYTDPTASDKERFFNYATNIAMGIAIEVLLEVVKEKFSQ